MKKKIRFLSIALILSIVFINFNFIERVSAGPAPALTSFKIVDYTNYNENARYSKNSKPTLVRDEFPLIINTVQSGYGNCRIYLDDKELKDYSESWILSKTGIGYVVSGFKTVIKINPSEKKLYKGYHTVEIKCSGTAGGGIRSDSFSFYIA
ncbi:MAG: hypothetical protein E7214_15975 [Clostridium sp.]|nr:hypothetical protein [Clostridium sp.]